MTTTTTRTVHQLTSSQLVDILDAVEAGVGAIRCAAAWIAAGRDVWVFTTAYRDQVQIISTADGRTSLPYIHDANGERYFPYGYISATDPLASIAAGLPLADEVGDGYCAHCGSHSTRIVAKALCLGCYNAIILALATIPEAADPAQPTLF